MDIDHLRKQIDLIDDRILELLIQRSILSLRIGERKRGENRSIDNPEREQEILSRLRNKDASPLTPEMVRLIYRAIIQSCRELQHQHPDDGDDT